MKAVDFMAKVLRRETGKSATWANRITRSIARSRTVYPIKEGPELVPVKK